MSLVLATSAYSEKEEEKKFVLEEVDSPNVRMTRLKDGSGEVFTRSLDERVLTKKTYSSNKLVRVTVYRMDAYGNPMSCRIYDGNENEIFKAQYGYRKTDGQLVLEEMFDSRVKHIDRNGKEMPVRRFYYIYDAIGNLEKPIAITLIPGKTADELYGKPTALDAAPPGR